MWRGGCTILPVCNDILTLGYLVLFILLVSYDVENIWNDIDDVIIKTLISAHPILKHNYRLVYETLSQGFLAFIEIYRQQSS